MSNIIKINNHSINTTEPEGEVMNNCVKRETIAPPFPFIQRPSDYTRLPQETVNTIRSLCACGNLYKTDEQIQTIASSLPLTFMGENLSIARTIMLYNYIINYPTYLSDNFSKNELFNATSFIDQHSQIFYGFLNDKNLYQECQFILPEPITILTPMEDFCKPIFCFLSNKNLLTHPFIGVSLLLYLIYRLTYEDEIFRNPYIDWSPMFNDLNKISQQHFIFNSGVAFIINSFALNIINHKEDIPERAKAAEDYKELYEEALKTIKGKEELLHEYYN